MCCCCRLKSCLCCFNLHRGVQVLGAVAVIAAVVVLITGIVQLEQAKNRAAAENGQLITNGLWDAVIVPYYTAFLENYVSLVKEVHYFCLKLKDE